MEITLCLFDVSFVFSLRTLFVAGEHCDTDTANWASKAFKAPTLDHWWQTETGHAITASCVGLSSRLDPPEGSTGLSVPGWNGKNSLHD